MNIGQLLYDAKLSVLVKEDLEYFINKSYAQEKLLNDISKSPDLKFPLGIKPDFFLHLVHWSIYFNQKYHNLLIPVRDVAIEDILYEKKILLTVFNGVLHQNIIDKFEESFKSSGNENKANLQTFIFKMVKEQLKYEENIEAIARFYSDKQDSIGDYQKFKIALKLHEFNDKNMNKRKVTI